MPDLSKAIPLNSLDKLEQTLLDLQAAYEATSDREARQKIRSRLIQAKTKARYGAAKAKTEAKRAQKTEMALWILTWLENPPIFGEWVKLRRRESTSGPSL